MGKTVSMKKATMVPSPTRETTHLQVHPLMHWTTELTWNQDLQTRGAKGPMEGHVLTRIELDGKYGRSVCWTPMDDPGESSTAFLLMISFFSFWFVGQHNMVHRSKSAIFHISAKPFLKKGIYFFFQNFAHVPPSCNNISFLNFQIQYVQCNLQFVLVKDYFFWPVDNFSDIVTTSWGKCNSIKFRSKLGIFRPFFPPTNILYTI